MKTDRRHFIAGMLATGLCPPPSWADAGSPAYLSAAGRPDGRFMLCGIDPDLNVAFEVPLPARGHAAAAHPIRPEAVAFARRPGTFAVVVDCRTGQQKAILHAPAGRHFYGHGTFSSDGSLLYTTENDFEAGQGRIGVWDADKGYRRVDEWHSGGIGPHDIKRVTGSERLVVANGGIDTHPASGRTKLNIATMRPNLSYLDQGAVTETATLPRALHKSSIRHLAVAPSGQVFFAMQWQGAGLTEALVGAHRSGGEITLLQADAEDLRHMRGYVGSIAVSANGETIAATSPKGGRVQFYTASSMGWVDTVSIHDVCGVAPLKDGFVVTSGTGKMLTLASLEKAKHRRAPAMWDNHLITV